MKLISEIMCPNCAHSVSEKMPEDACQYFWECPSCGEIAKPKENDCCVFCSYGTVPCPPKQNENSNNCC
ncbi:MAG: hypothetical protein CL666_13400 [Balneola sp.]|nr:hypothetical protein [Balneola sp.]